MEERDDDTAGVPDMTMMPQITEDAINENLKRRYQHDLIYTYTGSILVAVNPYKELGCYTTEHMQTFRGRAFHSLPPHVFALAESAYSSLKNGERNQSVVISGESGAGKTETTKLILQYLCAAGGQATWAEQQILEANTVLEAFGNAKTVRNDNSSRFGKFVEVRLDNRGGIRGAVLRDFLLERARITGPAPRETNYHVFYQLLEGAKHNAELRTALRLRDDVHYKYLRPSDEEVPMDSEHKKLEALQLALTVLQVPPHMCEGLFKVLAAVLWLGNVQFQDVDGERSNLAAEDAEAVDAVANLLGLAPPTAQRVLLERQINVRGNVTDIPLRLPEARENRHAMARALYSRTFAWLVRHVNSCSAPGREAPRALGVLDIFGFENFASNSLEQLCINYANEKLHMFFNNYVFALEQEIYRQEGIVYNRIPFTDNASCLELLERPPRSLLKLLSEQCHMPKGCDGAYLTNIQGEFGEHQSFVKGSRRKWEEEFGVQHYAGAVSYSVRGFVDKNRDTQQDAFIDHLSRSANPFVRELADYASELAPPQQDCALSSPNSTSTTQRGTSKGRPTVVDTFRAQLQSLVDMLQATDVWYVRCIKPNENKEAGKYDDELVREQLRYLGMNEIVRIRRDGYPIHLPKPQFQARYRCLLPHPRPKDPDISTIMAIVAAPQGDWQVGHTKVFVRSSVHSPLDARRTALLQASALRIQKCYKSSIKRRQYLQWRSAAIILQSAWRGWKERCCFLRKRRAALTLQRHLRGAFAREVAHALREMKRVNTEIKMREERNSLAEKANQERAELENMADQLRHAPAAARADSVNLDNLFDFLADVPSQRGAPDGEPSGHRPTIAEIGDSMERLVDDLDMELEHVLAKEQSDLRTAEQRKPDGAPSDACPPPPSTLPLQNIAAPALPLTSPLTNGMSPLTAMSSSFTNGVSSMSSSLILPPPPPPMDGPVDESPVFPPPPVGLPEPQGPPPPPPQPVVKETTPPERTNGVIPNGVPVLSGKEPIYEAVIPRPPDGRELSPPMSPPPPPESNGFTPKEPEPESMDAPLPPPPSQVHAQPAYTQRAKTPPPPLPVDTCLTPPPINGDVMSSDRTIRRKARIERHLQQLEVAASPPASAVPASPPADATTDLAEFAKLYFNDHPRSPEGTILGTLSRKSSKSLELLTKEEMIKYHKGNNIPTSHIQLHDPESVTAAVNIFRDLCRYMRGELTVDKETHIIQSLIAKGLEREELRDEILVQCVRQINECPVEEWAERVWLILCLCAVAWQPSRGLSRYYVAWLRVLTRHGPANRAAHCAQWCLDNCRGAAPRLLPPSTVEIAAMRRLGTIVCRFFFLDGRTKAIDVHPADTAAAAAARLADKLGLAAAARQGWAVYQQRGGREEYVRAQQYLYDVIAAWEMQQGPGGGSADNRFVFKRRLFRGGRSLPHDPVEVALLYAQAVHSVVKMDEFPVSEKVALQLAGLQAQVSLGEPPPSPPPPHTRAYYSQPEQFLPQRVARARPSHQWVSEREVKVALQLAGLQAQVSLGEPPPSHTRAYYSQPEQFLPQRVARARPSHLWVSEREVKVALQLAGLQAQVSLGEPPPSHTRAYYSQPEQFLPQRVARARPSHQRVSEREVKVALQLAGLQAQVSLSEPLPSHTRAYYSQPEQYLPQRVARARPSHQWVSEREVKVALQLAGLQAQVSLGEPPPSHTRAYYSQPEQYLPQRVARARPSHQWVSEREVKVALQLAGLQAQVSLSEPPPSHTRAYYSQPEQYLPQRVARARPSHQWVSEREVKVALQLAGLQAQVSLSEPLPSHTRAYYSQPEQYLPQRVARARPSHHWVSEREVKVALQLAGLQAQVSLSEPPPSHTRAYYSQPEQYLPQRVARARPSHQWVSEREVKVTLQLAGLQAQVSLSEPLPSHTRAYYSQPEQYLPQRVARARPSHHWVSEREVKVALQLAGLQAQVSLSEPPPSHTRAYYSQPEQYLPQRVARARPSHQWVSEREVKVTLQLAGLQAQVSLSEPLPSHTRAYYSQPEQYLPQRVARARPSHQWATILAQAHRQYGAGRAELTAKALYLSCVMQYPLYGVTLFPVTYKGYWAHGPNVLLGVGSEGVVLVRPADKVVLAEYPYNNIAALLMDPVDNGLTMSLTHHGQGDGHRCIVLESPQKNEAAWLMAAYSPVLANGLADEPSRRAAPASERSRLAGALKSARRALVDSGMLRRPTEMSSGNFLRNTLRRLSKHRLEKVRLDMAAESQGECYKGFPPGYWGWSRALPHSLTRLNEAEEVAAHQIFKDIMSHAGLSTQEGSTSNLSNNNSTSSQESESDDRVSLAQALLQRCLNKDTLLCELYAQLIKQTTDHPEPSSRVTARHWALLCACVGAALPPVKPLRRLLLAHLRYRGTALHTGEEGKFARRAEQVALSIAQVPRRLAAPSKEELLCAAARRPMHIRVLLLDGKQHGLVFGPAATADQLVNMLREKIGLAEAATAEGSLSDFAVRKVHYTAKHLLKKDLFTPETRPACLRNLYERATTDQLSADVMEQMRKESQQSPFLMITPVLSAKRRRMYRRVDVDIETHIPSIVEHLRKWTSREAMGEVTVAPDASMRIASSVTLTPDELSEVGSGDDEPIDHRLPSPEEQLRVIATKFPPEVIAIDTSGKFFDRMSTSRKSLTQIESTVGETDTVKRRTRSRKPRGKRRNTISGTDQKELREAIAGDTSNTLAPEDLDDSTVIRSRSSDLLKRTPIDPTVKKSHFNSLKQWGKNRLKMIGRSPSASRDSFRDSLRSERNDTKSPTRTEESPQQETVTMRRKRTSDEDRRSHQRCASYSSSEKSIGLPTNIQTTATISAGVKLRGASGQRKLRRSGVGKDEIHSSSGNWSASSESGRTSIGSEITTTTVPPKSTTSAGTSINSLNHHGPCSSIISRRRFLNTSGSGSVTSEGTLTPDIIHDLHEDLETSSEFSCDTEGYYTSFHMDSGLKTLKEEDVSPSTPMHTSNALSNSSNSQNMTAENEYELFGKGSTSTTTSSAGTVCTTLMAAGSDRSLIIGPTVPERKSSLTKINRSKGNNIHSANASLDRSMNSTYSKSPFSSLRYNPVRSYTEKQLHNHSSPEISDLPQSTITITRHVGNHMTAVAEIHTETDVESAKKSTGTSSPDSGHNTSSSPIEDSVSSAHGKNSLSEQDYSESSDLEGTDRIERIRYKTTISSARIPSLCVITPNPSDDESETSNKDSETNKTGNFEPVAEMKKSSSRPKLELPAEEKPKEVKNTSDSGKPTGKLHTQISLKSSLLPLNNLMCKLKGVLPHKLTSKKSPSAKDIDTSGDMYDAGDYVTIADVKNNNQKISLNRGLYGNNDIVRKNLQTVLSGRLPDTEYVSLNELPNCLNESKDYLEHSLETKQSPTLEEMQRKGAKVTLDSQGQVIYSSDTLKRRKGAHTTFEPGPFVQEVKPTTSVIHREIADVVKVIDETDFPYEPPSKPTSPQLGKVIIKAPVKPDGPVTTEFVALPSPKPSTIITATPVTETPALQTQTSAVAPRQLAPPRVVEALTRTGAYVNIHDADGVSLSPTKDDPADYRHSSADQPYLNIPLHVRRARPLVHLAPLHPARHPPPPRAAHNTIQYASPPPAPQPQYWTLPGRTAAQPALPRSTTYDQRTPITNLPKPSRIPPPRQVQNEESRISPIDPRSTGAFKSSTPSNKENVVDLGSRLLSPVRSTMTNEELYAVIHKSKKKLNIKEPERCESPALSTISLSPVNSESSLYSKGTQRHPETGYLGEPRSRSSWAAPVDQRASSLAQSAHRGQKTETTCADRHGPAPQISRLDFKKLLLQRSVKLNTNPEAKSTKLSAVEQLKLSKEMNQPASPVADRSQVNILDLSGSPKTYAHRKVFKPIPQAQPASPGRANALIKEHKNTPKILLSPKAQWRFSSPRSDVLSSPILEANNEDDTSNSSGEKHDSSTSPSQPKTIPINTNQHFGARRNLIPINEHQFERDTDSPELVQGIFPLGANDKADTPSRAEILQARRAEFFSKPPEASPPKLSSFRQPSASKASTRSKTSPEKRTPSPSSLETAL